MKQRKQRRRMKKRQRMAMLAVIAWIVFGAVAALVYVALSGEGDDGVTVEVIAAELSEEAIQGEALFKANCQACHGVNAAGTKLGPPLIHDIYNPGHHSDKAFYLAAQIGVRAHHWPYGDMPPQPQVKEAEVALIVRFIREMQEANGIVYKRYGG